MTWIQHVDVLTALLLTACLAPRFARDLFFELTKWPRFSWVIGLSVGAGYLMTATSYVLYVIVGKHG